MIRLVRTTVRAKLKVAEDYYRVIGLGWVKVRAKMGGCRVSVSWGSGASAARLGSDAARGAGHYP